METNPFGSMKDVLFSNLNLSLQNSCLNHSLEMNESWTLKYLNKWTMNNNYETWTYGL